MAATLYSDHVLGSTRMLKDFLQESNGIASAKSRTASFKALAIRAVKRISFPLLPRSLSPRRLRKRDREIGGDFVVKIKDIIRWRSFRDLIDETAAAAAVDFADSPDFYAAAATTTTTTTATSSKSSSWCESDFTAEDSPSWRGCSGDGEVGEKYFPCVGEDLTKATTAHAEDDEKVEALSRCNDEEEEETLLKERARRLLEQVDAAISFSETCSTAERRPDRLLVEFFRRELRDSRESEIEEDDQKWNCLVLKGKEAYVREMEREGKWSVFCDEEKVELGLQFEKGILGSLLDELLFDIFQF